MTTDSPIKSWIEERRTIHTGGRDVLLRSSYELERESGIEEGADIDAIVDAHNNLPHAMDALQAVLELLDAWEPPDPCTGPDITKCVDCLRAQEMRKAIEGAIND